MTKLTWDQVHEIRRLRAEEGISHGQLAEQFGVTKGNISCLLTGKTWQGSPETNVKLVWEGDSSAGGEFWLALALEDPITQSGIWVLQMGEPMRTHVVPHDVLRSRRKVYLRSTAQRISDRSRL